MTFYLLTRTVGQLIVGLANMGLFLVTGSTK